MTENHISQAKALYEEMLGCRAILDAFDLRKQFGRELDALLVELHALVQDGSGDYPYRVLEVIRESYTRVVTGIVNNLKNTESVELTEPRALMERLRAQCKLIDLLREECVRAGQEYRCEKRRLEELLASSSERGSGWADLIADSEQRVRDTRLKYERAQRTYLRSGMMR